MSVLRKNQKYTKINVFLDWIIRMLIYGALMMVMSKLFKNTIHIDYSMYGFWSFLLAIIIYCLNKIIRPMLVFITLPLTGLTMGLFYPFINVIILKIADFILGSHFDTKGIFMICLVALLLGFLNLLLDNILVRPLLRKEG